ncbi:acetyltransferase-like protein [Strigomonas culicis]|uniref:Acetyltransferase-like protein n=1 Tax=Strigomonas culicis TaxID=28005 RepID=S9W5Z3_9TRYP|nr:acetyltransferase-like protein [Strigomonas culicis]|eukprot:EPY34616.1 acetyltransferase-like protein [Strigomonas culicis]
MFVSTSVSVAVLCFLCVVDNVLISFFLFFPLPHFFPWHHPHYKSIYFFFVCFDLYNYLSIIRIAMSSPAFTIRKAERADCAEILRLIKDLAIYEKMPDMVTVDLAHMESEGFSRPTPLWEAYVAEVPAPEAPRMVGIALFYYRYSTWKGKMLYLEDFYVDADYRAQGIGKVLFERVIAHAKDPATDCSGMVWQALDWNTNALNFYKKYNANFDAGWVNCVLNFPEHPNSKVQK